MPYLYAAVTVIAKGYEIDQNVKEATILRLESFNIVANKSGRTAPNVKKIEVGRAFPSQFVGVIFKNLFGKSINTEY